MFDAGVAMLRVRPILGELDGAFGIHARTHSVAWRRRRGIPIVLWPTLALLLLYAVAYVHFAVQLATFPFDLDQGEGYDAWSAWLLNQGQLPYTSNAAFPYYSSNYPPLWSYLVSIPMAWFGPGLLPARLVSAGAAVLTAGVLGLAARRMSGGSKLAGFLAAGFFLASPYVFHTTPLARVNGTALLFAVVGLTLFEAPTRRRVILGSMALLAALFAKPTAVDAVVAGLAALVLNNWRLGTLSAGIIGGVGLAVVAALMVVTDGAFWLNVVAGNANPFDLSQLWAYLTSFSTVHCVLLTMAAAECARALWLKRWSPWAMYFLTATVATVSVAKWGAGESYFLGSIAAACVLAACWAARVVERSARWGGLHTRIALGTALFIQCLLLSHAALSSLVPWLPDRGPQSNLLGRPPTDADYQAAESLVVDIQRRPGPALVEDPSFAVAAGQPLIGNATHLRNLYQAGLWDPTPLVHDVQARRFGVVILNAELYPEPVLAAIGDSYFLDRSVRVNGATYRVFLPGSD
jgi:hypothetical protein